MSGTKSAIIWDEESEMVKFFVIDGNHRRFQDVFINSGGDEDAEENLWQLMYDSDNKLRHKPCSQDEFESAVRGGAKIVYCGFC